MPFRNTRALIIRIGFGGPLYYEYNKELQLCIGNYSGSYIIGDWALGVWGSGFRGLGSKGVRS